MVEAGEPETPGLCGPGPSVDNRSAGPQGRAGGDYPFFSADSSFTTVPPLSVHSFSLFTLFQP
jgi:hypothetical protein